MTLPLRVFVRAICVTILSAGAAAAQENTEWKVPRFSDDAAAVYRAAAGASAKKDSEVLVLYDEHTFTFDAEGKAVRTKYVVYKVLSQKGVEGWDSLRMQWEPWHEEKPVVRARVITQDHANHPLDAKTITDSPASDEDEEEYGDRRIVRAPLPAIAPGVVVEEEIKVRETAPLFAAGVVQRIYFGMEAPVLETQLLLDAPSSLNLQYKAQLLPELKIQRQEENGRVRVRLVQGPMEALENVESYLPSEQPAFPQVTFSTAASWQRVAASYAALVDQRVQEGNVTELAAQLTKGKNSTDEKLTALVQYLSREVRYTGVEFDEAGIVPHPPTQTLKQKYGDCKDKATLLVALARAAGIPAQVALLKVGTREDVVTDLPGMGGFDHAIVYVPGNPARWIDATDEYARLGELPSSDQGRWSLIAQADSAVMVRTPESSSKENRLYERREIYLAENGPARVVEISEPSGTFESGYRANYADADDKQMRKSLSGYVENEYLAEKLTKYERTDPRDLSRQFRLTLESAPAKRGSTDLEVAVAAIRVESLFHNLPNELQQREKAEKEKAEEGDESAPKKRVSDYELDEAFFADWEYKIVPPVGFRAKPLPDKKTLNLGPGIFTQEFSVDTDGTVHGRLTFDSVKRRYTLVEAKEMSAGVAALKEAPAILINFEPIASALLAEGKVRESFQARRELIAMHPKEAVHHLQMAKALLAAGMGQAAREEARKATELEPKSALARKTLAEILEFDLVGREFRFGSDYAGAEKAYRAAQQLDPEDKGITANLAILLEFNSAGERYGRGAKLKEAVTEYRKLKDDELKEWGVRNNPAFALFYAGEIAEARKEAEGLNPPLKGLIVASVAINSGAQAAMVEARKWTTGEEEFKSTIKTAGDMTMRYRAYPVAAELLEAGASGSNSSNVMALAAMLRKATKREELVYKDNPSGLFGRMFRDAVDGKLTLADMEAISSRNALVVERREDPDETKKHLRAGAQMTGMFLRQGLPVDAMIDVMMQIVQITSEGDDKNGYRVTVRVPGQVTSQEYIVIEDGHYRVLDSSEKPNAVALEILDRVRANNLNGARVLLDWVREVQHLSGGDDALAGFAFPRLWTKGKEGDARQTKLAAAALACETKETAADGIAVLEPALREAASDSERLNISLGLLDGYSALRWYDKLYALASSLAKEHPESKRVFLDRETALRGGGKYEEADTLAEEWLKREPGDVQALRALMLSAVSAEKYTLAREGAMKIIQIEKAESGDYNNQAWYSLFTGKTDASDVEAATKAAQLSKTSASTLHTLGCAYAEVAKTKEAREVLIQAMDLLNLDEPDDNYSYAFGRIAEQDGELKAAETYYKAVKKPALAEAIPGSSYRLAQRRLVEVSKQMSASKN